MRNGLEEDLENFEQSLKNIDADYKMTYSMNDVLGEEYRETLNRARYRIETEIEIIKSKIELNLD